MADGVLERFWDKVDRQADHRCWGWLAYRDSDGYGAVGRNGTGERRAHRIAYVLLVGPIPEGLVIDHLCRNRACVNPAHMEPVTVRENTLRGTSRTAANARKTHCQYGHEFTPENTYNDSRGNRECRTCKREQYGKGTGAPANAAKTECIRGHSLTDPANVWLDANGYRYCRECRSFRRKRSRARKAVA